MASVIRDGSNEVKEPNKGFSKTKRLEVMN